MNVTLLSVLCSPEVLSVTVSRDASPTPLRETGAETHITTVLHAPEDTIGVGNKANRVAETVAKDLAIGVVVEPVGGRFGGVEDLDDGAARGGLLGSHVQVGVAANLDENQVGIRHSSDGAGDWDNVSEVLY